MDFMCIKEEIGKLIDQRDELEGELKYHANAVRTISNQIDETKLLLTHTELLLGSLREEYIETIILPDPVVTANEAYLDTVKNSVPFWWKKEDGTNKYHEDVNILPSGEALVDEDYHVKLLVDEIPFVSYNTAIFVSNDTPSRSAVKVTKLGDLDYRVIPPLPPGKLMSLPDVFSYEIMFNEGMLILLENKRLSIWISFEDYASTFKEDTIEDLPSNFVGS